MCLGNTCTHQKGGDNSQVSSDSSGPCLTGCSQGMKCKMPLGNPLKAPSHGVGFQCELRAVSVHHQMASISVFLLVRLYSCMSIDHHFRGIPCWSPPHHCHASSFKAPNRVHTLASGGNVTTVKDWGKKTQPPRGDTR